MKRLILLTLIGLPLLGFSQIFKVLTTDGTGDDHSFGLDVTEVAYAMTANQDSLYVRITHDKARGGDFGFALALDTNLNPNDGHPINQTNMVGNPNLSMQSDILILGYQNGFFPGVFVEAYGPSGNIMPSFPVLFDTTDSKFSIFRLPISALGGKIDFNLIAFVGSFDISASGPSDAIPNTGFAQIRESSIGQDEFKLTSQIYPNPASDYFQLAYSGQLKVYNLRGELVKDIEVEHDQRIDCSDLSPSIYHLMMEDGRSAGKLLIQ